MTDPIRYVASDAISRALAEADPALGALIDSVGSVEFSPEDASDPFLSLLRAIVGQQVSGAAATSIYRRLAETVGETPEALAGASVAELRAAGLSGRKAEYVHDLARAVLTCELNLGALDELPDEEIERQLTAIRGIGPWTVHMFLLFALRRPDVIAPGDLGIRQAAGRLLELGRAATPAEVCAAAERWRPYRSAAMLYLYREAGMGREAHE